MSKAEPLVSVIIACKNNSKYIERSLDSLQAQSYKNWELIIVDNFSTDGTFELAQKYTDKVYQLGPERSTQFNYGFTKSKGDLIYRIGAEFLLEPDVIEKCVNKIQEGYDALAIHNRSNNTDGIWSRVRYYERESYKGSEVVVATRFWKRDVFESVGGFDENLVANEDFDLHNRIVSKGYRWTHVDAVEVHLGEPKNLIEVWNKFYYYGKTISNYIKKDKRNKKHIKIVRPSFKNIYSKIYKEEGIGLLIAFWIYMTVKFIAGGIGYLVGPKKILVANKSINIDKDKINHKKELLVSVIIVNYNGQKWLKKCFDSLLNQTYKNFEIIFVDNNSSDDSINFLEKNYKDKKIKIIKNIENSGFAGGNNIGIKEAKGECILFLNNDSWVEEDFIQNIVGFYQNNKYDVVAPYERSYDKDQTFSPYKISIDILGHPIYFRKKLDKAKDFYLSGVSLFFSKKLYKETKGLDTNFFMYFEETDWFWRLNLLNKTFSHIPDIYVYHHGAGSTGAGVKYLSFLWRNQNTLQMLLKNYSILALIFILPIYFIQNILEIIFFLFILKPKISLSYLQGWYFNIKYLRRTLAERKWVQFNRIVNDFEIMKKMYIGSAKFKHLLEFFKL